MKSIIANLCARMLIKNLSATSPRYLRAIKTALREFNCKKMQWSGEPRFREVVSEDVQPSFINQPSVLESELP